MEKSAINLDLILQDSPKELDEAQAPAVDGGPGAWQAVTANQTTEGGSIVVRVSLSDSMRFFRLRK